MQLIRRYLNVWVSHICSNSLASLENNIVADYRESVLIPQQIAPKDNARWQRRETYQKK